MRINKHDTQGTKPLLGKGELGYDDYVAGGDVGRVYVGTGSENIALAEKSEIDSHVNRVDNPHNVTKAQVGLGSVDNTADVDKNVLSATKWTTARTITLSGDVAGSVSMDGTANVSITTTVQPNSVALGTDTTGNYVAGITQGTGITVSGTAGEGWSPTVAITNVGTAGTYTKVTTNAQGQVTSGTTLAATDIPALDASKITTGTLPVVIGGTGATTSTGTGSVVLSTNPTLTIPNIGIATAKSLTISGTGAITSKQSGIAATLTDLSSGISNPFVVPEINVGATYGYIPMLSTRVLSSAGYMNNISIGAYRPESTWNNSGVYIAMGGNDSYPTEAFILKNGGKLESTLGAITMTGHITGNAGTATTLQTARTINGVSFDGSANITIADSTKLPLTGGTLTGDIQLGANRLSFSTTTPDIAWLNYGDRISAGSTLARGVNVGNLLISNAWADSSKVPTNGAYIKGNIAINNTPTVWTTASVLEVGGLASYGNVFYGGSYTTGGAYFGSNANYNGGWLYNATTNRPAVMISLNDTGLGSIDFNVASAGTSNSAITWKKAVTIDNNGVLNASFGITGTSFNSITGLASVAPIVAGTAAVGTSTLTARQDHVHPAQTTITGNAGTATTLQTARTIGASGDVTGTATSFNGSASITIPMTLANSGVTAGTYSKVTVDAKGRVTAGLTPTMEDIPDATFKRSVRCATTANITLSGTQTIDGIAVVVGDRVLVKDQTTASQNGIYLVLTGAWIRAVDADSSSKIASALVAVDSGTLLGGKLFDNDFKTTDTLGTTAMTWSINLNDGSLLTAGSTSVGIVKYSGTTAVAGQFDGGTTTPTGTTRLNYGGYFYPTYINLTGSADTATASSHVFVETGSDGYVRPKTLANFKTEIFASPTLTGTKEVKVALAANAIDLNLGSLFTKTISGATTFTVSNIAATGNVNSFILELTNAGSAVITWWSGVKWAGGIAPTLTTSGIDILGFYSHDGGTTWRGVLMAKDSK